MESQLLVARKCRDAVVVERESNDLPGIALERGQPAIEEERARNALVAVAVEQKGIDRARAITWRTQLLDGLIQQRR